MTGADDGAKSHVQPVRVLAVCTGNICRSPLVERLLQAGLNEQFPGEFVVQSAGTGALIGNSIDPEVAKFLREKGEEADDFAARQLTPKILATQDLVLALTREHRSKIVQMSPAALRRTFTLREFARLMSQLEMNQTLGGAESWRAILPKALRARTPPSRPDMDDVIDPYRRSQEIYQETNRLIWETTRAILQRNHR
ncbi:low molecular weight phosphatase family protein [Arthrobacter sp. NPDC092385]|uniref:arsenate reductase/protein-tyrosine-phosphatase family protein n=1 Tax=Arthrobacter sp. NPDC092385 TaxID=3363943 RepID=UPI00380B0169